MTVIGDVPFALEEIQDERIDIGDTDDQCHGIHSRTAIRCNHVAGCNREYEEQNAENCGSFQFRGFVWVWVAMTGAGWLLRPG